MKTKNEILTISEKEHDAKIRNGAVKPVHLPVIHSISDVVKYQFCSEIIAYKKSMNLQQNDIAQIIDVNKSEVSKLFSYELSKFSQERLIHFVELLISHGAKINLDHVWDKVKIQSRRLQKKLQREHSPTEETHL